MLQNGQLVPIRPQMEHEAVLFPGIHAPPRLPARVCVGAKVLTPDQTALALEFKFAKWAPLSECLRSLISDVEECCRVTGGGRPCP